MLRGIVSVALVLCALGGVAYADNKEAAKQAYTEGKRQYDLGEYAAALDAFKRAYLNYEEPVFLFNIAQCYRAVGDRPSAVRTYRAFLRNWPKAPNKEQVERIVSELEAAIAQDQTAKTTPPTDTMPPKNGGETASKPAVATAEKPQQAPAHATAEPKPQTAEKPAATATKPEQAPPPATVPEPKPEVAHKPPPPKDDSGLVEIEPNFERPSGSGKGLKWWAWTLIAVGVAGVAAAAIVLGVTQTGGSKFDSTLPDFNATALHTATLVRF